MTAPTDTGIQLNMNFADLPKENRFRKHLENAVFSLLFEIRVPSSDADLGSALARVSPIAEFVMHNQDFPCGLAFLDADPDFQSYPIVDFASALCPTDRDRHLLYLSGRGRQEESIAGIMAQCRLEGFRNVVCVSGRPSMKQKPVHVFESTAMLRLNRENQEPLFAGAAVNPFKYEICADLWQSFKMAKKVRAGASFGVIQFGLDAAKIQELIWQLSRFGCRVPLFARALLLTPSGMEDVCSGQEPGIQFSKDFQSSVRSEMQHSRVQFEAAQWRRLQLLAAGARFLGCSGLQLGGIDTISGVQTACRMIREAFAEFRTYEDWLGAVKDYYSRVELAPFPYRYYLFDNLLRKNLDFEQAKLCSHQMPEPGKWEWFRYSLASSLFAKADQNPASARRLSKKLIVSCRGCGKCRLPKTVFVCPETCPAGFADGPCGETDVSGKCPFLKSECIHAKRIRLAIRLNDYASLDQTLC